jgi:hypothetical protein
MSYNQTHMWLQGSTPGSRASWARALDAVAALERSSAQAELIDHMTAAYPDLANPHTLWVAAYDLLGSRTC